MTKEKNFSSPTSNKMREMIEGLSPAERAKLSDPNFITEDDADIIMSRRIAKEPGAVSFDEVLRQEGLTRRRNHAVS